MKLPKTLTLTALLLATAACNSNESVATFAKNADQLSDLLPHIAAIPYNACVDQHVYQQIANPNQLLDRNRALKDCPVQELARDRTLTEYGVLTLYLQTLGKLATGNSKAPASAKSIATTAAKLDGLNSKHQTDVAGLASIVTQAYLRARTAHALRDAIAAADTHVQNLCQAFTTEVVREMLTALQIEEDQLRDLYSVNGRPAEAIHILLARQLDTDLTQISRNRDLIRRYDSLLHQIAEAHAKLYANRNRLNARDLLDDLTDRSSAIAADLKTAAK